MTLVLVYFRALKRKPVICKSDGAFRFCRFLVPSRQRSHRKSFYRHGKYFAKENFRVPASTSCKTGRPERAVSLHLASSGSHSQHGIWFILAAREACHIYMLFTSRKVRIGKNCARGLRYRPRLQAEGRYSRQRAQFFPIRTDLGWGITFLFFSTTERKACERLEHFRAVIMARFATN